MIRASILQDGLFENVKHGVPQDTTKPFIFIPLFEVFFPTQ